MPVHLSYRETKKMKRKDGKAKYRLRSAVIVNYYINDGSKKLSTKTYRKIENVNNGQNS